MAKNSRSTSLITQEKAMKQYKEKRAKRVSLEYYVKIECERPFILPFEAKISLFLFMQKAREQA